VTKQLRSLLRPNQLGMLSDYEHADWKSLGWGALGPLFTLVGRICGGLGRTTVHAFANNHKPTRDSKSWTRFQFVVERARAICKERSTISAPVPAPVS
jgi:hypothetical protein